MNKAILLVRVSTQQQDLDQQREAVKERALRDGYSEDSLIIIEDKESAVLLSEEERNGLNRLKNLINSDPSIDAVYSFEPSRISRKEATLFNIRDFLQLKHVHLYFLLPDLKVFNDDWTINPNANLMFGIFTTMAANEGIERKARFRRARARLKPQGRFLGGIPPFGYEVSDGGYIVICEEEADIVRKIYQLYLTGFHSTATIARELDQLGLTNKQRRPFSRQFVLYLLRNPLYCSGENNIEPIVTKADFLKAQEISSNLQTKPASEYNGNIYYCRGLIHPNPEVYPDFARNSFIVRKSNTTYVCPLTKDSISEILLDSLAWHFAREWKLADLNNPDKLYQRRVKFKELHNELYDKWHEANIKLVALDVKKEKVVKKEIDGIISAARAEQWIAEYQAEQNSLIEQLNDIDRQMQELKSTIDRLDGQHQIDIDTLSSLTDDTLRLGYIRDIIKSIIFVGRRSRILAEFDIIDLEDVHHRFLIRTTSRKPSYYYISTDEDGHEVLTPYPVALERRYTRQGSSNHRAE